MDKKLEDIWRRENPDSLEFTRYDRSFGKPEFSSARNTFFIKNIKTTTLQ